MKQNEAFLYSSMFGLSNLSHLHFEEVAKVVSLSNGDTLCSEDRVCRDNVDEHVRLSVCQHSLLDGD